VIFWLGSLHLVRLEFAVFEGLRERDCLIIEPRPINLQGINPQRIILDASALAEILEDFALVGASVVTGSPTVPRGSRSTRMRNALMLDSSASSAWLVQRVRRGSIGQNSDR
jgi:hypothetical protein